jgi:ATP-dependent exoDNAse (exonuclease V) alpha subunit
MPWELTIEQNIQLAREYVQQEFVNEGMVADLFINDHKKSDGQSRPHGRVMLTTREITSEGFGKKVIEWGAKKYLFRWRKAWADITNKHLALHGHNARIDHRSFVEQGIALEPQHKIGPGKREERFAKTENRRIAKENGEKLLEDPKIALETITLLKPTFTRKDLTEFLSRHTSDPNQFQEVYDKVLACEDLIPLGIDQKNLERFTIKGIDPEVQTKSLAPCA